MPKVESRLKSVRSYFGDRRAAAVTSDDIERYKYARLNDARKPATVNRKMASISAVLNVLTLVLMMIPDCIYGLDNVLVEKG